MAAQHVAQGFMHQVCGRVITHCASAILGVYLSANHLSKFESASAEFAVMAKHVGLNFLCIENGKSGRTVRTKQLTRITNLPTRLGVKRRSVKHDDRVLARRNLLNRCTAHIQR